MAENSTPETSTPAETPKKKRGPGSALNKIEQTIKTAKDANAYLTAFRSTVGAEGVKPSRLFNDNGFTSLGFEEISDKGKLNMIACLADSIQSPEVLAVANQVVADTGRRKIEADMIEMYTDMAKRHATTLDKFAQAQPNGKTGKHFKTFNEMIAFAVESALNAPADAVEAVEAEA